jgi:hypothetical protein
MLTQPGTFALVRAIFPFNPVFCSSSRRLNTVFREGSLVPSFPYKKVTSLLSRGSEFMAIFQLLCLRALPIRVLGIWGRAGRIYGAGTVKRGRDAAELQGRL